MRKVLGTKARPRVSVTRSNRYIRAQAVDDQKGHTIASFSEKNLEDVKGTKSERAFVVGENLAKALKSKKISSVVFDRGGYKYLGRVKALAEGARKGGLKF